MARDPAIKGFDMAELPAQKSLQASAWKETWIGAGQEFEALASRGFPAHRSAFTCLPVAWYC